MSKLKIAIFTFLITFLLVQAFPLLMTYFSPKVRHIVFHGTYMKMFIGTRINQIRTYKAIDNFNALVDNRAIKFEGTRPIIIVESKFKEREILGEALPLPSYCLIKIDPDLTDRIYEEVVLHEMVHCYGYDHALNPCSLMAAALNPGCPKMAKNLSIYMYAKELAKISQ
jgi:hypothetical protein